MNAEREAAELVGLCALNRVPGVGPRNFRKLLDRFGSATAIFAASVADLESFGVPAGLRAALAAPDWPGAERDYAWLQQGQRQLLVLGDANYPAQLAAVVGAPPLLFVLGAVNALYTPQLAIVGSRNPTANGVQLAQRFASDLVLDGFTVTSGLALGIDAAAHRGALAAQGPTVAVAGTGLDRVYPARHQELAAQICAGGGALVSEFPIGTPPVAQNFPRRNRIISGLALGTLVVEAALQSGSLITAKYAVEQGREVFAVPGSVHNALAKGCHALLREGAKLVETVADIRAELDWLSGGNSVNYQPLNHATADPDGGSDSLTPEYRMLLDKLGYDPTTVDTLVDATGLTARELSSMLLILEFKGYISSQAGGTYVRRSAR